MAFPGEFPSTRTCPPLAQGGRRGRADAVRRQPPSTPSWNMVELAALARAGGRVRARPRRRGGARDQGRRGDTPLRRERRLQGGPPCISWLRPWVKLSSRDLIPATRATVAKQMATTEAATMSTLMVVRLPLYVPASSETIWSRFTRTSSRSLPRKMSVSSPPGGAGSRSSGPLQACGLRVGVWVHGVGATADYFSTLALTGCEKFRTLPLLSFTLKSKSRES
jgi:hypothetical protein